MISRLLEFDIIKKYDGGGILLRMGLILMVVISSIGDPFYRISVTLVLWLLRVTA